jgi:hypothetical protein
MAIRLNSTLRSYIVDSGVVAVLGSGSALLRLYTGTQPADGGGSTSGCVLLCTIDTTAPAWASASNGTAALSAGSYTGTTGTSGTVEWARLSDSGGTSYVVDGNCGTAATCDYVIDSAVFSTAGATVTLTAATLIMPAA